MQEGPARGRIVLNVGGTRYCTTLQTLRKHPSTLLGSMFSPDNASMTQPGPDGTYFIDRNGRVSTGDQP